MEEERVLHAVALNEKTNNYNPKEDQEEDEILSTSLSTRLEEKRSAIKAWENTFVGRKPTREDVVRDERARAMYREYKALLTESEDLERRRKSSRRRNDATTTTGGGLSLIHISEPTRPY